MNKFIKSKQVGTTCSHCEIAHGVFGFHRAGKPGESTVGMQIRTSASMMIEPKQRHLEMLELMRAMPAPKLRGI